MMFHEACGSFMFSGYDFILCIPTSILEMSEGAQRNVRESIDMSILQLVLRYLINRLNLINLFLFKRKGIG